MSRRVVLSLGRHVTLLLVLVVVVVVVVEGILLTRRELVWWGWSCSRTWLLWATSSPGGAP